MFKGTGMYRIVAVTIFTLLRVGFAQNCCLCDDCDFMMNPDVELYDMDLETFVSCERFAEEVFRKFEAGGAQCTWLQDLFKPPCCLTSLTDERRNLSTWTATSGAKTGSTTYPFQSSSFNRAAPVSYSNWGSVQQSAPVSTARTTGFTSSFGSSGGCQQQSGTCNFNCPNVPANRRAIYVSVDPSLSGRSEPRFGALCPDVQNQFNCQNIKSSDIRCTLTVSRYRSECGCTGYQNNGASFFGTTKSSGTVGVWTISP